ARSVEIAAHRDDELVGTKPAGGGSRHAACRKRRATLVAPRFLHEFAQIRIAIDELERPGLRYREVCAERELIREVALLAAGERARAAGPIVPLDRIHVVARSADAK